MFVNLTIVHHHPVKSSVTVCSRKGKEPIVVLFSSLWNWQNGDWLWPCITNHLH